MNPLLRGSAAHVFVELLDDPQLTPDDLHHLGRVLRLRAGAAVTCSDGQGAWRPCEFTGGGLLPTAGIERDEAQSVHVYAAIPKGDRLDWMVQKLTEVGVTRLTLVDFERGVVRWSGDRIGKQLERLRRIAREAASQSRRVWLPSIEGPVSARELPMEGVVFADPDGAPLGKADAGSAVVIGPEGGFAPSEIDGRDRRSMGRNVLRVETAAVVAATLSVVLASTGR
jgi:16S rRNA (uracil1498-N3)-methyltransferase